MEIMRAGIVGYGNIGKGVEKVLNQQKDMRLTTVFTRRDPASLQLNNPDAAAVRLEDAADMKNDIDVLFLCGGSATDLPEQGPRLASLFNTVDSFDTHAKIPEYLQAMQKAAQNTTAVISSGWDPGLFSMMRSLFGSVLPEGTDYTFWGEGVSQGHSDAVRRIPGVKNAIQYTVPMEDAVEKVRAGHSPELSVRQKHRRVCYVAPEPSADLPAIEQAIVSMPHYFSDYDTSVHFETEEAVSARLTRMNHGGLVFRNGTTGKNRHSLEFSLRLDSNPEFTASVMVCYARAACRLAHEGVFGAKTVLDIPLSYLSPVSRDDLIRTLL